MQRLSLGGAALKGVATLILALAPAAARADEVQFETADKVELKGTFYPGSKKSACVIMLHKLGGNRQQKGWEELAQALNKAGYAVLGFDFRGHGDSTSVGPIFWRSGVHNSMIKGASKMPTKISYKDFPPNYLPYLANDVAAAKRYLDQQNDAGACNSSNVVVVGAEEGAAIGALWMASEWYRNKMTKNAFGIPAPDPSGKKEADDLAAAIWLSIPHKLGNYDVSSWLKGPGNKLRDKVPMVFFYGDKDTADSKAANSLFSSLKAAGKAKLEFTALRGKAVKLTGADLLGKKALKTEEDITGYLENVLQKRGQKAWVQRDPERGPTLQLIPLQLLNIR